LSLRSRLRPLKNRLVRARDHVLDTQDWPRAETEFRDRLSRVHDVEGAVDLVFGYQGAGFYRNLAPNQDRTEILTLARRVHAITPRVVVEIGTRGGGTLFTWSQASEALELLVSIDLPQGIHGGGYPVQRGRLYEMFVSNRPDAHLALLRRDSQAADTRAEVVTLLGGRPIDFLFIDGDHRYEGVKRDWESWEPLVRPGGLVAFHDIQHDAPVDTIQVWRLWDEIKAAHPERTEEVLHEPTPGKYGIGIYTKA